jgi:hypothetical protein
MNHRSSRTRLSTAVADLRPSISLRYPAEFTSAGLLRMFGTPGGSTLQCRNLALAWPLKSRAIIQEEEIMRTLFLAGALAVAGLVAPASAQVAIDTPVGGVRVGPQPHHYRHYDRPGYRSYGYYRGYDRGCRTVTIERDDGSVRRIRRCG